MKVELSTSDIFPASWGRDAVRGAGKAAGVTVTSRTCPRTRTTTRLLYLKMPFAETQWALSSLKMFYLRHSRPMPVNETHWNRIVPALLSKAVAPPPRRQRGLWNQDRDPVRQGRLINWTNADWVTHLEKAAGPQAERRRRPRELPFMTHAR